MVACVWRVAWLLCRGPPSPVQYGLFPSWLAVHWIGCEPSYLEFMCAADPPLLVGAAAFERDCLSRCFLSLELLIPAPTLQKESCLLLNIPFNFWYIRKQGRAAFVCCQRTNGHVEGARIRILAAGDGGGGGYSARGCVFLTRIGGAGVLLVVWFVSQFHVTLSVPADDACCFRRQGSSLCVELCKSVEGSSLRRADYCVKYSVCTKSRVTSLSFAWSPDAAGADSASAVLVLVDDRFFFSRMKEGTN